ncbi:MAG: ChaN family lipoprotein [Chitinophagaceae bacterium]|nr:ChaN family lipoprotein [Chitinophagaceae bacterium]
MKAFFLSLSMAMAVSIAAQPTNTSYKIYNTATQQVTTVEKIVADCKDVNVLFFGEEHDDSIGHTLELKILQELERHYAGQLALSMEMFETDCQLPLDEYLEGFISDFRFQKAARVWSNYKDYKPLIEFSKTNHIPVIAANTPRRYVSMVSSKGMEALQALPKASKKFLPPLPYDTLAGKYYEKFQGFMQGGSPGTNNPKIYYSQCLWDAGMSYSIYKYWKKNKRKKIFHMAGKFHLDEKLGTIAQLLIRDAKLKVKNISCFSDASFDNPDWEKFKNLGDYIIITDPGVKRSF